MTQKRIIFACYHFYLDPSNGAAITTREILSAMAQRGWNTETFCGCGLDFQENHNVRLIIADRKISLDQSIKNKGTLPFSLLMFQDGGLKSSVFLPEENLYVPPEYAGMFFLRLLQARINQPKPKILVTYGGYWLGGHWLELGHIHGMKNVRLPQNLAYDDPAYFHDVDLIQGGVCTNF